MVQHRAEYEAILTFRLQKSYLDRRRVRGYPNFPTECDEYEAILGFKLQNPIWTDAEYEAILGYINYLN